MRKSAKSMIKKGITTFVDFRESGLEGVLLVQKALYDIPIGEVKLGRIEFNKEIINALKDQSCGAKGITTKEYNIISVKQENEDLGFVGTPNKIKTNV